MRPTDLARHAGATRGYLTACVALGAAGAVLIVAQATFLADGIAAVFDGHGLTTRTVEALIIVVCLRAIVVWGQESAAVHAAAAVKAQLRHKLHIHLVRLGPGWLVGNRTGEITTLTTRGLDALDGYFARYLPQTVLAGLIPIIVLARIGPADWIAAATIVLTLPLIPVFMALVGWTTRDKTAVQLSTLARLSHHFLDVVAGLPTLKAFNRDHAQITSIRTITDAYRRTTMRTLRLAFLSSLILELLATLSVALVAVGVGLRLVDGRLDLRTGLLVLILAPEAYLPLRRLGAEYHAAAEGVAAAESIIAILDTPPTLTGTVTALPDDAPLRISDLTVRYPDRDAPALDNFSLVVASGEAVAVVGASGTGKSTLLRAILGFVDIAPGTVRLGTLDLTDAEPDAWRTRIAWVPQHPVLAPGTVADNVRLGRFGADDGDVARAAEAAGLPEDLLARTVGEAGRGLSAGQRQRVALARAFLRDAPIVLLDEPTAGLDADTEAAVLPAIRRLLTGRTGIVVAHRPSLLPLADRVVTMTPALAGAS
jgi:thiol reductant ABC exporter CydD subunit